MSSRNSSAPSTPGLADDTTSREYCSTDVHINNAYTGLTQYDDIYAAIQSKPDEVHQLYGQDFESGATEENIKKLVAIQNMWGVDLIERIADRDYLTSAKEDYSWKSPEQEEEEDDAKFMGEMEDWAAATDNSVHAVAWLDNHLSAELEQLSSIGTKKCDEYNVLNWSLIDDYKLRGREMEPINVGQCTAATPQDGAV